MFTKETFIDYFQQILNMEKEMEKGYIYILDNMSDPEYRTFFERLANEERFHQSKVQGLIDLFKK